MKNLKKVIFKNYIIEVDCISYSPEYTLTRCGFYVNNPNSGKRMRFWGVDFSSFDKTGNVLIKFGEEYKLRFEVEDHYFKLYYNNEIIFEGSCMGGQCESSEIGLCSLKGNNYFKNFKFKSLSI